MRSEIIVFFLSVPLLGTLLIGCGSAKPLPPPCVPSAKTPTGKEVNVYFGCGCFWHMQYMFVKSEMTELCRQGAGITSRTAYAGGTQTGPDGLVCYHNTMGKADYGTMGHAEIVSLDVPEAAFDAFADQFWEACPGGIRRDTQDLGGEYRSMVGLPGGINSTLIAQLRKNAGSVKLVAGQGDEGDTLSPEGPPYSPPGTVLVYDTATFSAHIAEKEHQFHDDMVESYGAAYNALQNMAKKTSCPGDQGGIWGV